MSCPFCGAPLPEAVAYCPGCGQPVAGPAEARFTYAGFWLRLAAWLLDSIMCVVALMVAALIIGVVLGIVLSIKSGVSREEAGQRGEAIGNTIGFPLFVGVCWLYYALLESSGWRATLGKKAFGLRVSDLEGNRISFLRASTRTWAKVLSGLPLGIGFFMAGFTEKKQALHDQIARCLVLKKI